MSLLPSKSVSFPHIVTEFASYFNLFADAAHQNSKDKGFWEKDRNDGECLALIHSEVSELLEVLRAEPDAMSEKIEEFYATEEELADIIIRVGDFAAARQLNVGGAVIAKMNYNASRPVKHGKLF